MAATKRKVLPARFYRTATGAEPARKWLKALSREDKRIRGDGHRYGRIRVVGGHANLSTVGVKARTVGGEGLSDSKSDRARPVLYTSRTQVLLHGFIKKTQQTPENDLDLAVRRQKEVEGGKAAKACGLFVR